MAVLLTETCSCSRLYGIYIFFLIVYILLNCYLQKNLQCPDCLKRFPMANVLKYHQQKAHQANAQICNICGKVVNDGRMKVHLRRAHTNEKNLQCDKCDYRTNEKQQLKRHMYSHSEDPMEGRRYLCEICHKAFFTNQELKQHLMIHGGIKPYKCKLCSGSFSNFSGHRQHMMKTVSVDLLVYTTA